MHKLLLSLSCMLSLCASQQYELENSIEKLDVEAVRNYINQNIIDPKRKNLILKASDHQTKLYRPSTITQSFPDLLKLTLGSFGTFLSASVLFFALTQNEVVISQQNRINLKDNFLKFLMIPICSTTGYLSFNAARSGWRLKHAYNKFTKARDIQYILHGITN